MARGGSGNFDSDTAMDFVGGLLDELIARVQDAVAESSRLEPDEYDGEVVPCIVDIIATLYDLTGSASIPKPDIVAGWRTKFMEVWEAHIDGLGVSPQHKKSRRAVLKESFARLERLSRRAFK
jgi:hypothetical protein